MNALFRIAVVLIAGIANWEFLSAQDDLPPGIQIFRDLRYLEGDGNAGRLDLAMPEAKPDKPQPAIVIIHGGGWIEGGKSSFSIIKNRPPGNVFDFAKLGFVAICINYRLSKEAPYPAALHDCKSAIRWVRANAEKY